MRAAPGTKTAERERTDRERWLQRAYDELRASIDVVLFCDDCCTGCRGVLRQSMHLAEQIRTGELLEKRKRKTEG